MDEKEKLFSAFPPSTIAAWEEKIREDLKGADYAKKLIHNTLENISIKPYYSADDLKHKEYLEQEPGAFPYVRTSRQDSNDWKIRQDFKVTDTEIAAEKARLAESRGVTSVGFDLSAKGDLYYHDFRKLITAVDLSKTCLNLIAGDRAPQILDFLLKALDELNIEKAQLKGSLEFDPLGYLASTGGFYDSEEADLHEAAKMMDTVRRELPGLRILAVNSHIFSDAGASAVQELAFGLSMISEYLVRLTDEKQQAADVLNHLQWNLGTGSDYFMEIAKIRAARMLVSALLSGFATGKIETPVFIHSITTTWNKTLFDPNVNLLRVTTEAMAAILGGCNSLLVKPFDAIYNEPTDFSERLARNVQIILKEESYFSKVIDPAAGSYYIESLTDSLTENAWNLFLKTDEKGGYVRSFTSGFIGEEIAEISKRRSQMVASRRELLLGTNQYPNVNESINGCISEDIAFPEPVVNTRKIADPVTPSRGAAEFEKLRLSVEQHSGHRPKVFMLTYGNLAMRLARSQFSANFFACAGYEIADNLGFKTAREGVDAALAAKADIIVVCSSDEEYASFVPEVAALANNRAIIVVAGAPASMEELRQKGITEFIHIRSNVLETLKSFHNKLGIELK